MRDRFRQNIIQLKNPQNLGWLVPLLIGGMVYYVTMCRTVYVGDSGEFALVFKTLGIAHPPGYPLFSLIGRLFVALTGFFRAAFSANLLSVLIAATVIPVLFFALKGSDKPVLAAILTLIWAFSPLFWSETAGVEVYGLNLFFIALLVTLSLGDYPRKWLLIAYLCGLSFAHHLTVITVIPALIFAFFSERSTPKWKLLGSGLILFMLGLSVYLYLPVRSSLSPLADWGHPSTLSLLINHVTASQYQQTVMFSLSNLLSSSQLFFSILVANWWWIGFILVIIGIIYGIRQNLRRAILLLILLVSNIIITAFYHIPDIDPYYLPALFACFMFMSDGVIFLWEKYAIPNTRRLIMGVAGVAALSMLLLNFNRMDNSGHRLAEDYGKLVLDTANSGTVFTNDDNSSFPALYMRYGENYNPSVEVFDRAVRFKALSDAASKSTGRFIGEYYRARSAYTESTPGDKHLVKSHYYYNPEWTDLGVELYSNGILYTTSAPGSVSPIPELWNGEEPGDSKSRQILVNLDLCRGESALQAKYPNPTAARQAFKRALDLLGNEPRAALHNQLGISFRHLKQGDLALNAYENALEATRISRIEREEIVFNISNIYKDRGNEFAAENDINGALQAFQQALKYDPSNSRLLYNVGVIYINYLNDPQKGKPYLETYLKLNPSDKKVSDLVRSLR